MTLSSQNKSTSTASWRRACRRHPQLADLACDMRRTRAPSIWPDYWYAWRRTEARLYRMVRDPHDVKIAREVLLNAYRERAMRGGAA